jgi:hypothetical protein
MASVIETADDRPLFVRVTLPMTGDSLRLRYDPGDKVADLLAVLEGTWNLNTSRSWLPVLVGSAGGIPWGIQLHRRDRLPIHGETLEEYCADQLGVDYPGATAYIDEELAPQEAEERGWRKGGLSLFNERGRVIGGIRRYPADWPQGDLQVLIVSNIAGG